MIQIVKRTLIVANLFLFLYCAAIAGMAYKDIKQVQSTIESMQKFPNKNQPLYEGVSVQNVLDKLDRTLNSEEERLKKHLKIGLLVPLVTTIAWNTLFYIITGAIPILTLFKRK